MNILIKYLFLINSFILFYVETSKILIFSPTISRSHIISNARVADTLASDGHNVTLLEVEFIVPVGELNASKIANKILVSGQFMDLKEVNPSMVAKMAFKNVDLIKQFIFGSILQTNFNKACESE
uniref:Glucuronosyltransferase n=1 Tax=Meloidogyne hapla TaxID=6305 RepID=A0A1I8BZS0_MELHA